MGLLELSAKFLVSAAADSSLRIWNPNTGECLAQLQGHPGPITCFHHDTHSNRLVSGSDGGVKLWELGSKILETRKRSDNSGGIGYEMIQGPNGPEPVYGRFMYDLAKSASGVWRVSMDERRLVTAVQREGGRTWFEVFDFGALDHLGSEIEGPGDTSIREQHLSPALNSPVQLFEPANADRNALHAPPPLFFGAPPVFQDTMANSQGSDLSMNETFEAPPVPMDTISESNQAPVPPGAPLLTTTRDIPMPLHNNQFTLESDGNTNQIPSFDAVTRESNAAGRGTRQNRPQ